MSSESPLSCCTRVFWDAVDFPFPKDLAPETIYNRMKLTLEEKMGFMGDLSIMAYVNSENFPDKSAYESAGFNIIYHQERHRFMLRDIAWWGVDSTYTSTFRFRGRSKVTFVVISSLSEEESIFLTFLESLKNACYNVRLIVPDDDNPPSPKLLDNTLSFEWLYHCLLQTGDPKRMKMTREVVQTTSPPQVPPIPHVYCPAVFLDLPPFRSICYDPAYITSYVIRAMSYFDGASSIMAYVDDPVYTCFPYEWVDAFTEFTIIPQLVSADSNARAHRMSVDIVSWAMDHPAAYFHPRDLLVFSENAKEGTDFYKALKALGERYYNVCVVLPPPSLGSGVMYRQLFSNHMPRISREDAIGFSSGLASLYNQDFHMSQIHVFCDAPTDISIILPALREKGYHSWVLFRPYLPYQADEPLLGYSDDDGYTCVPSIKVEGDSYAASARMLLDILFWAMNHDDLPQNLILVSQPSKGIDIVVQALEHRGFNIIFKPSDDEVASHTINDRFESLCKSPPRSANQVILVSPCRTLTDVSRRLEACQVIIFWLVDSCPSDPYEFRRKFRSTLEDKGYAGILSVTAYVVKGVNTDEEIKVCKKSGLQVRTTPQGDEYGKFSTMLLDMIKWTRHCLAPFNFLVISDHPFKDAVCDSLFADVTSRGFNVLCETLDYMVTFGSSLWSAESMLETSSSDS